MEVVLRPRFLKAVTRCNYCPTEMCVICGYRKNGQLPDSAQVDCSGCEKLVEVPDVTFKRAGVAATSQGLVFALSRVHKMACVACPNLKKIKLPQTLNVLYCARCPQLSAIVGPCEMDRMELYSCPELRTIPIAVGVRALSILGCPFVLFVPFEPAITELRLCLQPFTYASRRYALALHTTTEAKVRRWVWRSRVAARARAEALTWLIPPLANVVVGYLAPRQK